MKKTLLTLALTVACVGAFAQGKINVLNDANHLVYFTSDNSLVTETSNFRIDLYGYAGTGAGSLALITSVSMTAGNPGVFGPFNYNAPGIPGGSASTFQVRIFDPAGLASGQSAIFTMQPGGGIAYNSLFNPGGTTLSTWAAGTQVVPGGFGAIGVSVPEPTSMVLAGLGAASLLMFRRRS